MFKLLLGLYHAARAGTVTIGGVDVADITDRERRTCIGCVEQHFARVPGTVLEQITLGDPQITEEMARNAAKLAGIDAAIQALPEGYDTVCSDGMFSQGEWRLAVHRPRRRRSTPPCCCSTRSPRTSTLRPRPASWKRSRRASEGPHGAAPSPTASMRTSAAGR